MKQNDLKDFSVLMAALEEMFSDIPISRERVGLYFNLLKDLEMELVREGVIKVLLTRRYHKLPKPAEIRDAALGAIEDKALLAWNEVISRSWTGDKPKFEDPIVDEVITKAFGGWTAFMNENHPGDRRHFLECYRIYKREKEMKQLMTLKIKLLEK